jgi:hypothetical protein
VPWREARGRYHVILTMSTRSFISLAAALILLLYLSWRTRTKPSIKWLMDKALEDFASQFLSVDVGGDIAKAFEIQSFLSCRATNSERMPTTCSSFQGVYPDICQLLPGKKLLLVGPETTHFLHSLWLDVVERRRNQTHVCPGRDFCTFHHICRDPSISPGNSDRAERKKKLPSDNLLRATKSSLLQYTYSTTLYAASNRNDMLYQFPLVDPETGIQQASQYWLRRARRADVIILSRAPIPAPVSTYTLGPSGNWTFASGLCTQRKHFPANYCQLSLAHSLASAALDMTIRNFLPSVLQTIEKLATDTSFQGSLRIWHGNWFIQPSCLVSGLPRDMQLLANFWSCTGMGDSCDQMDPWTYFYNLQGNIKLYC